MEGTLHMWKVLNVTCDVVTRDVLVKKPHLKTLSDSSAEGNSAIRNVAKNFYIFALFFFLDSV